MNKNEKSNNCTVHTPPEVWILFLCFLSIADRDLVMDCILRMPDMFDEN
jgi:hypothetical protein